MKTILQDIVYSWRTKWSFRVAATYLLVLFIVSLLLPVLPLPYLPNQMDLDHVFLGPFEQSNHILGTDQLGRDVLINTLYGARSGLFLALPVMAVSVVVGTGFGALAGYFGNTKLKLQASTLLILIVCLLVLSYYIIYIPVQAKTLQLPRSVLYTSVGFGVSLCVVLWFGVRQILWRFKLFNKRINFPFDSITTRATELLTSLPNLLILITVAAFATPSVILVSIIFICTSWTTTARLARAEMLRIKQLPYIEAATSAGIPDKRIIYKHAVPNLLGPVVVSFIFGVAGLLAIESTLSFLGIGLPPTFPSWGRTIAGIKSNLSAWWLVAFPGGLLAITVLTLQICSSHLLRITQEKQT